MADPEIEARRAELNAWIAQTRANQKKLAVGVGVGLVVSLALLLWRVPVGGAGLGIVVLVAMCGFWITAGHIMDWRTRLTQLGKPKTLRMSGGGRRF
jgi:O-antigen/teichoic acid export membrane protein